MNKTYTINKNGIDFIDIFTDYSKNDKDLRKPLELKITLNEMNKNLQYNCSLCIEPQELIFDTSEGRFYFPAFNKITEDFENEISDFLSSLKYLPAYLSFNHIVKKRMYFLLKGDLERPYFPFYETPEHLEYSGLAHINARGKTYICSKEFEYDLAEFFLNNFIENMKVSENSYILADIVDTGKGINLKDIFFNFHSYIAFNNISLSDNMLYCSLSMDQDMITDEGKLFIHKYISRIIEEEKKNAEDL